MSLTLTVLSFKNQPITEINPAIIDTTGGGIGRSDDNALVLPDTEKFVSRHHATISFESGCYYLSDTSLGGVFISNRDTPLHNATERITDGMILRVGEYEIAVAIADKQAADDFLFVPEPKPDAFLQAVEPWLEPEDTDFNSLMNDNFASHADLVQTKTDAQPLAFESGLQGNHSPLFDSYIAPAISQASADIGIPENFSFDDFFSESPVEIKSPSLSKPAVDEDFDDFFGAAIGNLAAEIPQPVVVNEAAADNMPEPQILAWANDNHPNQTDDEAVTLIADTSTADAGDLANFFANTKTLLEQTLAPAKVQPVVTQDAPASRIEDDKINSQPAAGSPDRNLSKQTALNDNVLFNAFLQGAVVECTEIRPEQQAETLHRVGQMFRKLIDGTVAVLRSRAEFKSLCRVNMTVIRATNNNPLKFTVATDDVLRQLIENKTDGFLASTTAIEESFNDIMNHQLAMQAGIQASLSDLLKTFDPKIIEKQFDQGLVLQKKSKCWDKYEETYRNTVEDAVENFFGEEFVKAYEKQMSQLKSTRRSS